VSWIRLRGLRAGNLQRLDLDLPQGQWTAVHGPSGAGKSALLFRTLEPVARQRFRVLEDPHALPGTEEDWLPHVADSIEGLQPVLAAAGEIPRGRRKVEVGTALDLWPALQRVFMRHAERRCPKCAHHWRPLDEKALIARAQAAKEGARVLLFASCGGETSSSLLQAGWTRVRLGDAGLARLEEAPEQLPTEAWLLLDRLKWRPEQAERFLEASRAALRRRGGVLLEIDGHSQLSASPDRCPDCATALAERSWESLLGEREIDDLVYSERTWSDWVAAPLSEWRALPEEIGVRTRRRLEYLHRTRMGHITATRTLGTLSLGEGRRLELVALLAQVRCGQLALFDEPGMGLHGSERRALASLLHELVEQGNTVLTADPAREFLEAADHWLLLGPGGGPEGGTIVGQGSRADLPDPEDEVLGAAAGPASDHGVHAAQGSLRFKKLKTRYLSIPKLEMPLGQLVAVVGVSGSGKSTLLDEELVPRLREERDFQGKIPLGGVRVLLERALGSSAFSTVATLTGAWSEIRAAFAEGEEGRMRGITASDLVARVGQGACDRCRGHGVDAVVLPCPSCEGLGLREDLLELRLRNRALREWLTTPLDRLEKRLPADGRLRTLVRHLIAIGLGQRTFGERGRHLSLGERGRIALARSLASARRDRPQLFLLDEPCLGLPFREALKVVQLLQDLCAEGHSFWVAEHHEVFLRSADHVIELGPGAGPQGGQLLYAGVPAGLQDADTPTAAWLRSRSGQLAIPETRSAVPKPQSVALPDDFSRCGRRALEAALQRELATRSPLLADDVGGGLAGDVDLPVVESAELIALAPTAWPATAPHDARLGEVLGLTRAMERVVRGEGGPACAACGGRGPWSGLDAALRSSDPDGAPNGELLYTLRPQFPEGARGTEARFLLAAGFRRVWRAGERIALRAEDALLVDDEIWLDRFEAKDESRSGRIQDIEHQIKLLGGGELIARAGKSVWRYQVSACRDCGAREAGWRHQLAGRDLNRLLSDPLEASLEHLLEHGTERALFERAQRLLAATPLLTTPAMTTARTLDALQARTARLLGWLIAPVEGISFLHDQPLAELPPAFARRVCAALMDGAHGVHRWTDPEGYFLMEEGCEAAGTSNSKHAAELHQGLAVRPEPFPFGFDLEAQADPRRAQAEQRLRDALGLTVPLRLHYLRTEEARLRGWSDADLGAGSQARRCARCGGQGGRRAHPSLRLRCGECAGSGWARETAALEDRGLRWPDLGSRSLNELAEHFSASPSLSRVLEVAVQSGLGALWLDERMERLPRGLRAWAPILANLAERDDPGDELWAAPAAGWNSLELAGMASTIEVFASRHPTPVWRENHPVWASKIER
jgi:excinuclease UvrABC ATPase subunit